MKFRDDLSKGGWSDRKSKSSIVGFEYHFGAVCQQPSTPDSGKSITLLFVPLQFITASLDWQVPCSGAKELNAVWSMSGLSTSAS